MVKDLGVSNEIQQEIDRHTEILNEKWGGRWVSVPMRTFNVLQLLSGGTYSIMREVKREPETDLMYLEAGDDRIVFRNA